MKARMSKQLHQRKRSKKSKSDEWWTPDDVFESLCKQYGMKCMVDVACTLENSKCPVGCWYDWGKNALERDWNYMDKKRRRRTNWDVWCNPPNSQLSAFIKKAYEQYKKWKKLRIMMIVPANAVSSVAWWESIENPKDAGEDIFYKPIFKRISFLENGKKSKFSARNAYIVVIWGIKRKNSNMLIK